MFHFCSCFLDTTIYIPSFDGTSYLELKPLLSLPHPLNDSNNRLTRAEDTTFYLTVRTRSTQGTILFSEYSLPLKYIFTFWLLKYISLKGACKSSKPYHFIVHITGKQLDSYYQANVWEKYLNNLITNLVSKNLQSLLHSKSEFPRWQNKTPGHDSF